MINDRVYRFKVVGNYDDATLGSSSSALENVKTKFLICEDLVENLNAALPNNGYKYLVLRPSYLWNATSPKNYFGKTNEDGIYPIRPTYALNDNIQVLSCFDENIHFAHDLLAGAAGIAATLKAYILGITGTKVMNYSEINAATPIIKCYFVDINVDARTREIGGGGVSCVPIIPISPDEVFPAPPGGAKTAIVKVGDRNIPYYCVESTQVWFQDVLKVKLTDRLHVVNISSEFIKSCEKDSIYVSSFTAEKASLLGVRVLDHNIVIDNPSKTTTEAYITLNGIRKNCNIEKFISVDNSMMAKNNDFWENWKKA